ncbi:MAG: NAD/NADP octopine/nopaline dehydrogenase family protein [Caldilineaceae bacterium]|nr:NAD/NADP octopine/nopaline dehydrogenase family protein [Caldilineaceae bacterium]
MNLRYAVIGAGHGGKAMAAHLALMGFSVTLYNRTWENIAAIAARGGIELRSYVGGPQGFAELAGATSLLGEAVAHADIIMIVVPSTAHAELARGLAPHLRDGQIIVLHPGRTLGALEFAHVLQRHDCQARVTVTEAETLIYASRSEGPAEARIFSIKEAVPLAALPATATLPALEALAPAYPQFIDGIDVLHTGLNNMGAIFHPALTILNASRIEATRGEFEFYLEGVTPSVAHVLEVLDRERVTVAAALGIRARTAVEWLQMAYAARGTDLYDAIQHQPGYRGIMAPNTLNHRYISEDIPMSLVPIASLGKRHGVSTSGIDSIIRLGSILHRTNYWRSGRTVQKLGIEDLGVSELTRYVKEGDGEG